MKPIIAIDIDDTLADATEFLRLQVNARHDLSIPADAYKVRGPFWGYYEQVWKTYGVGHIVSLAEFEEEMIADQLHLPVLDGAREALKTLTDSYKIIFITARPSNWEPATKRWFAHHFDGLDAEIYFSKNHLDAKELSKGQLCVRLGATLLIDDNEDHCRSAAEAGIGAIRFGSYGWHEDAVADVPACRNWSEVLRYLDAG